MAKLNIDISVQAQAFAAAEARRRGLAGPAAYAANLLEETAARNGGHAGNALPPYADFFHATTLDQIAAEQHSKPIADAQALYGDFWPEHERLDEFLSAVRDWRRADAPVGHQE